MIKLILIIFALINISTDSIVGIYFSEKACLADLAKTETPSDYKCVGETKN